jgi:hypothetical protein
MAPVTSLENRVIDVVLGDPMRFKKVDTVVKHGRPLCFDGRAFSAVHDPENADE